MADLKRSIQNQFDRVADNYRTSTVHAQGEDLEQMVRLANLRGDEEVLDAGCGAGHAAVTIAPHVTRVTALDFTDSMLEQTAQLARERQIGNIQTRLGDVEELPFPSDHFDRIVSRYSAHHWPRPARALAEFRRVLRPDGQVILADVVGFDDPTTDTFLNSVELLRDPSHVRDFTESEWLDGFQRAGFQAEVGFRWRIWLDFASWTERMATPALHREAIASLLASAPAEVRKALGATDEGFFFPCAIFTAYPE